MQKPYIREDYFLWGRPVRVSFNKPELAVVWESFISEARMREMLKVIDFLVRQSPEVGTYNQSI